MGASLGSDIVVRDGIIDCEETGDVDGIMDVTFGATIKGGNVGFSDGAAIGVSDVLSVVTERGSIGAREGMGVKLTTVIGEGKLVGIEVGSRFSFVESLAVVGWKGLASE